MPRRRDLRNPDPEIDEYTINTDSDDDPQIQDERDMRKQGAKGSRSERPSASELVKRENELREQLKNDPTNEGIKQEMRNINDAQNDLINDLVNELQKGNDIDTSDLNKEQRTDLFKKYGEPAPTESIEELRRQRDELNMYGVGKEKELDALNQKLKDAEDAETNIPFYGPETPPAILDADEAEENLFRRQSRNPNEADSNLSRRESRRPVPESNTESDRGPGLMNSERQANVHPTEHITSAFNKATITTANGTESNDMRDFAHAHDSIANPGIFADLLASSAKVIKENLKDSIDQGAIEMAEGVIDKMFMLGGIPGGEMIKTPLKKALREYVETSQESRYSRPLTDNAVGIEQKKKLGDPVMYPILIIGVSFYLANLSDVFEMPNLDGVMGKYKRDYIMSLLTMMNVGEEGKQFAMFSLQQLPPELLTAFKKNKDKITPLSFEEAQPINNYVNKLDLKYKELFGEAFYFALEKENAGDTLKGLLDNLDNPHTLHEIAMGISTLDSIVYDVMNNDGLFLSLIATIGDKLRPINMQKEFNFMNHLIEGIVYYDRNQMPNGPQYKINNDLNIMMEVQNSKEDVALREFGNDVYVAFSGTKDIKKDFVRNIIRKGNSASQSDPKYSYTLKRGRTLIEKAKQIAQRKGGEVIILGYSLGSYDAMHSSLVNPTIKTILYHPYFSQNERTLQLLTDLKDRDANLRVLTTREDPFSVGINYYKDLLNVGYTRASKYHSPHDLENHIR